MLNGGDIVAIVKFEVAAADQVTMREAASPGPEKLGVVGGARLLSNLDGVGAGRRWCSGGRAAPHAGYGE